MESRSDVLSVEQAVEALAAAATARGIVLTHKSVGKLLYLADLHAVENRSAPFTGVEWEWYDYGPWSRAFYTAFAALVAVGCITQADTSNYYGSVEHRITATSVASREVAGSHAGHLDAVLDRYGHHTPNQLGEITYGTPPMVQAVAAGQRRVRLDLFVGLRPQASMIRMADALGEDPGLGDLDPSIPRTSVEPNDGQILRLRRPLFRTA